MSRIVSTTIGGKEASHQRSNRPSHLQVRHAKDQRPRIDRGVVSAIRSFFAALRSGSFAGSDPFLTDLSLARHKSLLSTETPTAGGKQGRAESGWRAGGGDAAINPLSSRAKVADSNRTRLRPGVSHVRSDPDHAFHAAANKIFTCED